MVTKKLRLKLLAFFMVTKKLRLKLLAFFMSAGKLYNSYKNNR